jgi:hypothetical protein
MTASLAPDLPDSELVFDLIVNGVCRYGFKWLGEMELMDVCDNDYKTDLAKLRMELYIDQFNRRSIPA